MEFYYGYDLEHMINITSKIEKIENEYFIPCDDNLRAKVYGDPYFGKLKFILLKFNQENIFIEHNISVIIPENITKIDSIRKVSLSEIRKIWWDKKGKYIQDPTERLKAIHHWISFSFGNLSEEWEEQWMTIKYLEKSDKVLELGSNYGRNTCLIASILENDENLVTLETCEQYIPGLNYNKEINQFRFHIEPSGLSKKKLIQKRWITTQWDFDILPDNEYFWVPTITWSDLQKKYPIDFNVLVADCEGALYYILKDEPDFLNQFKKIIVENDYIQMEHYQFVKSKMEENGFQMVFNLPGGLSWHCCKDCFYQVWIKN
jgi:hypothetical protein